MSVKLLTFEDGVVRIDGEELPGLLSDLRVSGKVRFDEQSVDKASGKKKTPQGWEDADISLTLYLLTDEAGTCYDKLAVLDGFFKRTDGRANPSIFTVANSHLLARGVRHVVVTLGSEGALVKGAESCERVAARRVEAVDTTGAGDTFNGALAVALSEGRPLSEAVRFATAASAIAVTRMGAQSAVPMREEVDALLAEV